MPKIDFQSIKSNYDLASMIEAETGQSVTYGRNIHCPFHADSTPSMSVYQDGRFYCHGCKVEGDLFDFLRMLWECDLRSVIDRLADPSVAATIRHIPQQAKPKTRIRPSIDSTLVDRYEAQLKDRELEYWHKQGIPPHVLMALRIGWTGKRYSFPWFYRGVLTATKLRRDDEVTPTLEPKYISAKGSRYTAPYNIDAVLTGAPDMVLIAEDEKSVLAAMRYSLTAIAAPAHSWKASWNGLLSYVKTIVIVADNDEAGIASAAAINAMLRRARTIKPPNGHKDLFDWHLHLRQQINDRDIERQTMIEWVNNG